MVAVAVCVAEASSAYHVEQARIAAVLANGLPVGQERGGRIGPMAIPREWLPILNLMGIDERSVAFDQCQNIMVGTWIIAFMDTLQRPNMGRYSPRDVARITTRVADRRRLWRPVVERAAALEGIPAALVDAVITAESEYVENARSKAGAIGFMQLMPKTAAMLRGGDPWDGEKNIHMGTRYLGQLVRQFGGDLTLALAGYNAGPAAVTRNGYKIPPFSETMKYVPKVLALYEAYSR